MKLIELLDESLLSSVKGKLVSSVSALLSLFKKNPHAELTTLEEFDVSQVGTILARVDTGASSCSIHATDIDVHDEEVTFKTEHGKTLTLPLAKMDTVRNGNGAKERAFVKLDYRWGGKTYSDVLTSLNDRSKLRRLLIGRNLIRELKLPVSINANDT